VLRHRIACNFTAQAEGITTDKVIEKLLASIPKTEKLDKPGTLKEIAFVVPQAKRLHALVKFAATTHGRC